MNSLKVSDPNGFLYIITDSHLDDLKSPADEFVEMLKKLDTPHTVVCLGDLFKIWLAPEKYWTDIHFKVFSEFKRLRDIGCNVVFIAGNREMLLPRKYDEIWKKILPFTHLSNHDLYLRWGKKSYAFVHGDTINYNDRKYLIWKSLTHSKIFETLFQLIPSFFAKKIAVFLEEILAKANNEYKIFFPEKEILEFAKSVLNKVDHYFVGHFHIDRKIKVKGVSGTLRIVPDWLSQKKILQINKLGEIEVLHFENESLKKIC